MVLRFSVPGRPVPAKRMTRRGKWSPRARAGLDYQAAVAWAAKAAHRGALDGELELSVRFVFSDRRHGDLSNLVKAVEDGVQYSGIIANDKQIVRYGRCEIVYGDEPRADVELREIARSAS